MKKLFAFAAAIMLATSAFAQTEAGRFFLMPKIGVTSSGETDAPEITTVVLGKEKKEPMKWRTDFMFGLGAGYQMTDKFALTAEVLYTVGGLEYRTAADVYSDDDNPQLESSMAVERKITNKYLAVPVLANYYILPGLAIKAGIQPMLNMSSEEFKSQTFNGKTEETTTKGDDYVNKFGIAIPVGASYEYKNFILDVRYVIGLTNIYKKEGNSRNATAQGVQISLGYKIPL